MRKKVFVCLGGLLLLILIVVTIGFIRARGNFKKQTNIPSGLLTIEERDVYGLSNVRYARIKGVVTEEIKKNENGIFFYKMQIVDDKGESNEYDVLLSWSSETVNERVFLIKKGEGFVEYNYEDFSKFIREMIGQTIDIEVILPPSELWQMWKNSDLVKNGVISVELIDLVKNSSDCTINGNLLTYSGENKSDLCNLLIFDLVIDD